MFYNCYLQDYCKVLRSEAFRRLQGKMQVLPPKIGDMHRTRLTHSLEVAQVARQLISFIKKKYVNNKNILALLPPSDLINTICISHDLGHPPFGHGGEYILNNLMLKHGGFEANAQTLRILKKLNLSKRTLLGVIKYPIIYSHAQKLVENNTVPKCIYDEDQIFIQNINNKSFDCAIMELADDIAYVTHDLEDVIKINLISQDEWRDFFYNNKIIILDKIYNAYFVQKDEKKFNYCILQLINYFIEQLEIEYINNTNTIKLRAEGQYLLNQIRKFVYKYVINSPNMLKIIKNGQDVITKVFNFYCENINLLPDNTKNKLLASNNKYRIICDYISGMTDLYLMRTYDAICQGKIASDKKDFIL